MSVASVAEFLNNATTNPDIGAQLEDAIRGLPPTEMAGAIAALATSHGYEFSDEDIALINQRLLGVSDQEGDAILEGVTGGSGDAFATLIAALDNALFNIHNLHQNAGRFP